MSPDIEVATWSRFLEVVERIDVGPAMPYAFRGHADAEWDLRPALLRRCLDFDISEEAALQIEDKALKEFQSQAHLHIPTNILQTTPDTVSWWTLMGHHGAPTRLLDWSFSIYVAAYFAVTSHPKKPGAIYILHRHTVVTEMAERYDGTGPPGNDAAIKSKFLAPGAPPALIHITRVNKTERMIAQQGLFTVCRNILGDHGQILEDCIPEKTEKVLFQVLLRISCCNPGRKPA